MFGHSSFRSEFDLENIIFPQKKNNQNEKNYFFN